MYAMKRILCASTAKKSAEDFIIEIHRYIHKYILTTLSFVMPALLHYFLKLFEQCVLDIQYYIYHIIKGNLVQI